MFSHFYADPHFSHSAIIQKDGRPFRTAEEMDEALILNYQQEVGSTDVVCWLGDTFFHGGRSRAKSIMERLPGTKVLVLGNHDHSVARMLDVGFSVVLHELATQIAGVRCRVSHYPYWVDKRFEVPDKFARRRPPRVDGEVLLHGHSHSWSPVTDQGTIDIGVTAWKYKPARFADVERLVQQLSHRQRRKGLLERLGLR